MDFNDSPAEAEFRASCVAFLAANAEPNEGAAGIWRWEDRMSLDEAVGAARAWQRTKHENGFACIQWPEEHGGRGLSLMHKIIFDQEEAKYDVPRGFLDIGLNICAPPLIAYASDEQKRRYLPKLASGEEIWCQLFSEPVAGSDLAGLRTRADRDGDDWVVNGQKVWNSGAHYADYGILVTRHDTSLPKHKGLTFFFLDMRTPGVDPRPIKQISGASGFNEVFLTNVRIPDAQRLGEVGEGWQVSLTTLMSERLSSSPRPPDFPNLLELARSVELESGPALENGAVRQRLADWFVEYQGLRYTRARLLTAISQGRKPGPEASIQKVISANKQQAIASFGADLQELGGILTGDDDAVAGGVFQSGYLSSPGGRIAAGTDEILRNIIAERVLGLPGDIRVDRDKPYRDIPGGDG
ncbi:MAG: acyl-CoA dehydrogenase family protein [Thermoanaerobaculia bacterium]|nr:acyl-CoA dehydrogenase family protein [Thermoanaerobaculia bacterium]